MIIALQLLGFLVISAGLLLPFIQKLIDRMLKTPTPEPSAFGYVPPNRGPRQQQQ